MDKLDFSEIEDAALSIGVTVELTGLQVAILVALVSTNSKSYLWQVAGEKPTASQWLVVLAELSALENVLLG